MPLSVMLDTLAPEDFHFYRRLYNIQPFGHKRDEFNTGLIAATVMNAARTASHQRVWSPTDFMPLTKAAKDSQVDHDEINAQIIESMVRRQQRRS